MKANIKKPYWQYIGLVLFTIFILSIILSKQEDNKQDKLYLAKPEVGDIYEIRTLTNQYTLYKVDAVQTDSVFVLVNEYETNKLTGLKKIEMNSPSSFIQDTVLGFSFKELVNMKEKGTINKVRRKNSISQ
jgi:hypothetical protein